MAIATGDSDERGQVTGWVLENDGTLTPIIKLKKEQPAAGEDGG